MRRDLWLPAGEPGAWRAGSAAAAWGAGVGFAVVCAVSFFNFRLNIARKGRGNSWAKGQKWYRTSTDCPKISGFGAFGRGAASVVEVGKLLLEVFDFGEVEGGDVGVVGVKGGVVLVIVFGAIKGFEGGDLGDDGAAEYFGLIELLHIGLGDALLIGTGKENCGAVLGAAVWTLAIQFCGVSGDGEKNFQQLAQRDLRRIVDYLYGLGVAGLAAADLLVVGIFHAAAGVARGGAGDTLYVLEDGLDAPEAAAC